MPSPRGTNLAQQYIDSSFLRPPVLALDQLEMTETGKHLMMKCLRLLKGRLNETELRELEERFADAPTPTFDDEPSPGPSSGWRQRVAEYLRSQGTSEDNIKEACDLVELGMRHASKHGGDKAGLDQRGGEGSEEGWRGQVARFMKSRGLSDDDVQELFKLHRDGLGLPRNALQAGVNGRLAPGNRLGEDAAAAQRVRRKFPEMARIEPEPSRRAQQRLACDTKVIDRIQAKKGFQIRRVFG
jgi:hypothetical protein